MNLDRALVTKCAQTGAVTSLLSRGITAESFARTPDGQECAEAFTWMASHTRKYNAPPSQQMFRERFPHWQGEGSEDPIEALADQFRANVKRRMFSAKITELASYESDPKRWDELDQLLIDAGRDLSAHFPAGEVAKFSEMTNRVDQYEAEKRDPKLQRSLLMNIDPFDKSTNGMRPGNVVTIAGFSGLGKSLLATWMIRNAIEQDARGLFLTLEMTKEEVLERLDTMVMHFSSKLLGARELPDADIANWRNIARQFKKTKNEIYVKDKMWGCTVDHVYAEINRYKPDITVVDYVQLMKTQTSNTSQWQTIAEVTNSLKQVALATDSVIVMVSQDGRDAAENGSTRSNMGGSISVYQAADIYIGLHQTDDMYDNDRMEVRLLKVRRGKRQPKAYLHWEPEHMTFEYINEDAPPSGANQFLKAA